MHRNPLNLNKSRYVMGLEILVLLASSFEYCIAASLPVTKILSAITTRYIRRDLLFLWNCIFDCWDPDCSPYLLKFTLCPRESFLPVVRNIGFLRIMPNLQLLPRFKVISTALASSLEENDWIIQARSFFREQALPLSWKVCLAFAMLARVNPRISRAKGQSCLDFIFQNPVNCFEFQLLSQVFSRIFFSCAFTVKMKNSVFSAGHSNRSLADESVWAHYSDILSCEYSVIVWISLRKNSVGKAREF